MSKSKLLTLHAHSDAICFGRGLLKIANQLGDAGATHVAEALTANTMLTSIDLIGEYIIIVAICFELIKLILVCDFYVENRQ